MERTMPESTLIRPRPALPDSASGPALAGGVAVAALMAAVLTWSSTMSVASAAMAAGRIAVEGNRKAVQHRDGGPIAAVLVREGQLVAKGQPLLTLDLSETKAELAVFASSEITLLCRAARLRAEANGAREFKLPDELAAKAGDPQVEAVYQQERAVFLAREAATLGQIGLLKQQIDSSRRQIAALEGRLKAAEAQVESIDGEYRSLQPLAERGLVARTRTLVLERGSAALRGDIEAVKALMAAESDKIHASELQIIQVHNDRQELIAKDLAETDSRLAEIVPRLRSARERLDRAVLVAPEAGFVYGLSVFNAGATVVPGQTAVEIVPADDPLVIAAEIQPTDINALHPGLPMDVHVLPYRQRYYGALQGTLEKVSADLIEDKANNRSYYRGVIKLNRQDVAAAGMELVPGMPVQVTIRTGNRTILAYFLDPIFQVYDFALKEK
jgi:HlyD family type I secretion membrane fusion protein